MDTEKCQACHIRQAEQIREKMEEVDIYIQRGRIRKRVGLERTDTEKGGVGEDGYGKGRVGKDGYAEGRDEPIRLQPKQRQGVCL